VQQTHVDGVPVFVADLPGPLTAGLVFGVGRQDETFVKGGITHLVEHLAMGALGRRSLDCNASVDLQVTEFTATGPAERVGEFLRDVCRTLAELPVDRLTVETDVLRTENGAVTGSALATLLETLYGTDGPGLAAAREPAMLSLTATDVHEWAARWFTRCNAAVWLTGPVPDGLVLPLPEGEPPVRRRPAVRTLRTPVWTEHPVPGSVAVGAAVDSRPGLGTALAVLRERVEDELRHRRGVTYTVETDRIPVDSRRRVATVVADVREGQEPLAARVLWQQLTGLAVEGPTEAELVRAREDLAAVLDDPRSHVGEAEAAAQHHVLGLPRTGLEELRRESGAVTADDVRDAAVALREAAVLCLPPDVDAVPPGLDRVPLSSADVVEGRSYARRRLSDAPRGSRLVVGDEGLSLVLSDDERLTVRWPDVVGLVRPAPGTWCVVTRHGFTVPLIAEEWRGGNEAVATVRAHVPAELQVVDDEVVGAESGLLLVRAGRRRVEEAIRIFRTDAEVAGNDECTAVRPVDGADLQALQSDIVLSVGRRTTTLVLWQDHTDLEYLLLRGTKRVDAHRWAATPGDPSALAAATGRNAEELRAVLSAAGDPAELLPALVTALGLPEEVPDLVAGRAVPTTTLVRGLGFREAMRATGRESEVPGEGSGSVLDRWLRLGRTRPARYRAVNALAALVCALLVWQLTGNPAAPDGWVDTVLLATAVVGLLGCLWDTRPPPRRVQAGGSARALGTSSGADTVTSSSKQ
jgi:predicted Zn-dependent peptidase